MPRPYRKRTLKIMQDPAHAVQDAMRAESERTNRKKKKEGEK